MNNHPFFKLPLILTMASFVISLSIMFSLILLRSHGTIAGFFEMFAITIGLFFVELPKLLLLIVLAVFALYRYAINIMTVKNILLVILVAIIINGFVLLFNFFALPLFIQFYSYIEQYYDPIITASFQLVIAVCKYFITAIVAYGSIVILKNLFDHDVKSQALQQYGSVRIHLILFLLLFMSILTLFLIPILLPILQNTIPYQNYNMAVINLFSLIILVFTLTFAIKKSFNYAFSTLQIAKIIKSVIFVMIAAVIVNCIVSVIIILIIKEVPYYYFNYNLILLLLLLIGVLQLIIICGIARVFTKRYFSATFNATE
ncbi:hypothetical protein [Orbus mooreae]|uniref:hypothetical protein n=1 Tax=Orbus mooreae TaxID=3074107 RepID=UPI00370D5A3D